MQTRRNRSHKKTKRKKKEKNEKAVATAEDGKKKGGAAGASKPAEDDGECHDRDHTYPYTPYPDLSMPIPSHLNHSQAPNAKPEPSDPLTSQQRTPEHSDSLASSQRIPNPTHLRPFLSLMSSRFLTPTLIPNPTLIRPLLFLASSQFPTNTLIPDPTSFDLHSFASSLFPTFHWSRDCGRVKPNHVPPSLDMS